jgi:SAM-dependent methyltransferase
MTACRSCHFASLDIVLSLGEQPLANALRTADELDEPEKRYPLDLGVCRACGLAQLTESVPPEALFRQYPYFSSVSDAFVEHARDLVARVVVDRRLDGSSLAMEAGSNDGYLLRHYVAAGVPVLGIDPARNIAAVAQDDGVPTIAEFFGRDVAAQLVSGGRRADVIHANNVIAHVPDLHDFVAGLAMILKPDGVAIIETPYVRDLVDRVEFDTIYHEHVFYYSLSSLVRVLAGHGLRITDVERLAVHGGSLRVFATPAAAAVRPSAAVADLVDEEQALGLDGSGFYSGLASQVEDVRRALTTMLGVARAEGRRVAAYGAAAKGAVLLNAFGIGPETIEFVADRSPHKQGLWMPGVRIPIRPAEDLLTLGVDSCLLLAWNFAEEIMRQQSDFTKAGGRFIIPLPEPVVIGGARELDAVR